MALVKYGGGIIQQSGSIAGNTFARNRFGNYVRSRTKPVNSESNRQQEVRAAIAYLVEYWRETLTKNQREDWMDYAKDVVMKNRLGESIKLTGFNHFIRSNAHEVRWGHLPTAAAPISHTIAAQDTTISIVASTGPMKLELHFKDDMPWCSEDGGNMFVSQGLPQNGHRYFFGGPWREVSELPGAASPGISSPQEIGIQFNIFAGQKQWISCRIRRADGRLSEPFTCNAIVT